MALLKFLCPVPASSCSISISEDQKSTEVEETVKKKRESYLKFLPKDKATIGAKAMIHKQKWSNKSFTTLQREGIEREYCARLEKSV